MALELEVFDSIIDGSRLEETEQAAGAVFREADLRAFAGRLNTDRFDEPTHTETLRAVIKQVLAIEAPIREDVLVWRVAQAHGFGRSGARIRDRILQLVDRAHPTTNESGLRFYWPIGTDPKIWSIYRRPTPGTYRKVDEVALPELRVLGRCVLNQGFREEDAVRAMAVELGLQRIRETARARIQSVLDDIVHHTIE